MVGRYGWIGVDLFFVLSGFLVSGLLFKEYQRTGSMRPWRFLMRRGFKIYPQFYLLLVVVFLTRFSNGNQGSMWADALFVQNYARHAEILTHTWSLAVEEHFYLLLTLALFSMMRRSKSGFDNLPWWILGASLLILSMRVVTSVVDPLTSTMSVAEMFANFERHTFSTHLRLDSLLMGVLLSYYRCFQPERLRKFARRFGSYFPMVSILLLTPVLIYPQSSPLIETVGFSMIAISFALLIISALYPVRPQNQDGLGFRSMAWLGRISYGFYLWHYPVILVATRYVGVHPLVLMLDVNTILLPTFVITLALAYLTTRFVEMPFLNLRDRLSASRNTSLVIDYRPVV